jgi:hypothetical protein
MPTKEWEAHMKDPEHQRLVKIFYDVIDKEYGIGE